MSIITQITDAISRYEDCKNHPNADSETDTIIDANVSELCVYKNLLNAGDLLTEKGVTKVTEAAVECMAFTDDLLSELFPQEEE